LFLLGIIAGYRDRIETFFDSGLSKAIFRYATLFLPRVSTLADVSGSIAASEAVDVTFLVSRIAGLFVFGLAALSLGIHLFERKDF
jgi:Cu-processing system permease protein